MLEAVGRARPLLVTSGRPRLDDDTLDGLRAALTPALEWEGAPASALRARREAGAVEALAAALDEAFRASWANATTSTEQLLEQHAQTLVVGLLSDGSTTGTRLTSEGGAAAPAAPSNAAGNAGDSPGEVDESTTPPAVIIGIGPQDPTTSDD